MSFSLAASKLNYSSIHASAVKDHLAYRPDIDGLRALAIIPVLLFHAFPEIMPGGFIGVDVFFVISGYLITRLILLGLEHNSFSFSDFYRRRVCRLFPALSVVLVATLLFGWYALYTKEYELVAKHVLTGTAFIQNFVLWQEADYFDVSSSLKPLLHLWSLAIEEQFYLVFPFLLWCASRLRVKLLLLISILGLSSLVLNLYWVKLAPTMTFYSPQTRFWELMAGAALAALPPHKMLHRTRHNTGMRRGDEPKQQTLKSAVSCLGLVLIIGSTFAFTKSHHFPGWRAMLPVLGAIMLLYAGRRAFINRVLLGNKLAIGIGLISYPLYLWHWPILSFAHIIQGDTPEVWIRVLALIASVILALLTYLLFEQPIRRSGKRQFWAIALGGLMLVIAAGAALVMAKGGQSRIEAYLQEDQQWKQRQPSMEDNCANYFPTWNNRKDSFRCYILDNKKPDIAVIGDSHAVRLFYGIVHHLGDDFNPALFPIGCAMPFYDISVAVAEKYRRRGYHLFDTQLINSALDFSKDDPAVKAIVLMTSACWRDIVDINNPLRYDYSEIVESKMRFTFEQLSEANKPVIYVLDNPLLDFNPSACVHRPLRIGVNNQACTVSLEDVKQQRREYFDVVNRVLADYPNIIAFNAADYLCDEQVCHSIIDGKKMYYDPSHLSSAGSVYIGQFLQKVIRDKLADSK